MDKNLNNIYKDLNLGQDNEYNENEQQEQSQGSQSVNNDLWKKFGRGNEVGNMLYSMYSAKEKPKIYYPPVKIKKKPTPAEELKMGKQMGPCPQKTVIEYPEPPRKESKYHPVDFIPRKKHEEEIQIELNKMRNQRAVAYGKRGVDRSKMIEELQEINRFGDKKHLDAALANEKFLKAKLAAGCNVKIDNKSRLRQKYNMNIAQNAMKHYEEKYGKNPADFLLSQPKNIEQVRSQQDQELEDLFDQIIYEIEERQQYLEDITQGGKVENKQIEERMKNEIVTRIGELQKVKELQMKGLKD